MNMMDLLRIPGLDNLDRIREMRQESKERMNKAIERQRRIYRLMSNAKEKNNIKQIYVCYMVCVRNPGSELFLGW